jgi:elongation factor G
MVEKPSALLRVKADETQILAEIGSGDIGALIGCKNTRSGDTLIDENDPEKIVLQGVRMPPPAFFCSIEANESREQKGLEVLLENLSKEDPSIGCKTDEESGQTLISGLGELHLEILRDRIELEYGIKAELGPMRVAYRESINASTEETLVLDKKVGGSSLFAELTVRVESTLGEYDM